MTTGNSDFSIGSAVWPGTSKVIEEAGELLQVLGKLIATSGETAHWDGTDLRERLCEEIADVTAALRFFCSENLTSEEAAAIVQRVDEKHLRFQAWHREHQVG